MDEYHHRMGAAADFRRDLEDLVCDHLGGCFSPAPSSSSSCSAAGGGGAGHEPDEAESSAARRRRRESRLLSRWVARQAEEVLSSMEREVERRNREAELLALARLHPVSTLDPSSFLLSSPATPPPRPQPTAPPSLLQMWRELEHRRADADQPFDREPSPDTADRDRVRQIARRLTDPADGATAAAATGEWLGETERQRVRLVREWVQMASQPRDSRAASRRDEPPRLRGRQARLDVITRMARERQRELQGISGYHAVSEFPRRSRNRIQGLLRGRFLRNGALLVEEERPPSVAARELGQLRQSHRTPTLRSESVVSSQDVSQSDASVPESGRLLGNDESQRGAEARAFTDSEDSAQTVLENVDLQEADADRAEVHSPSIPLDGTAVMQESLTQGDNMRQDETEDDTVFWQSSLDSRLDRWPSEIEEGADRNWGDNAEDLHSETVEDDDREHDHLQEEPDDWHDDESHGTVENWQDDYQDSALDTGPIPRTENRFIPPDDDNVYSMELRELLSRRSVSNLLSNGFGESLERLIRSYVQRSGHGPLNWNLDAAMPPSNPPNENQEQERNTETRQFQAPVNRPALVIPPPPLPPRQPLWHRELRHNNWSSRHREWDAINDLRSDMGRLQQGMSNMQRMLEACMDMQLELQRSVRQEVSAALNRFAGAEGSSMDLTDDGSKWNQVRKGTCCVCCDTQIDSLLYRCGHMCTCSKCANELVRSGGKCPLCRAPIVEVVRAYSVM
ncbi:hypothetical protein SEVIR_1G379000v4 [Setaria viridis]|uniref:RING-type domain-containing protein n=1 Tax=Setaria viridis TaxID=4556 RepID=A0A4U6WL87_SETVI|nr:uncharacterized protein LOC117841629 isoform X2 [Setaria viridis]TKW42359.1 hypothetical protein SEVIR_1G379000v2 [Setaria viridis]